eukprot:c25082_g5_i4 orf=794-1243(-)
MRCPTCHVHLASPLNGKQLTAASTNTSTTRSCTLYRSALSLSLYLLAAIFSSHALPARENVVPPSSLLLVRSRSAASQRALTHMHTDFLRSPSVYQPMCCQHICTHARTFYGSSGVEAFPLHTYPDVMVARLLFSYICRQLAANLRALH